MRNLIYIILSCFTFLIACHPGNNGHKSIDFSNEKSLMQDSRVYEGIKAAYPAVCEEYVLLRVRHDGSCWNSVGMTLLIYELIEAGEENFDRAIAYFKELITRTDAAVLEQKPIKDFFAILAEIRAKMDHRFSLELRNSSEDVYMALDTGFRKLIAYYGLQEGHKPAWAAEKEKPYSWHHMSDIKPLLRELGFKYGGIDSDPTARLDFNDYGFSADELALLGQNSPETRDFMGQKMPTMIALGTSPAYADVAVKKSFAESLRTGGK